MEEVNDILEGLTDTQREAVLYQGGPLLIIAGPGSGKTEVMARRVAYHVRSGAVWPEAVLAVTFTERAALSVRDRIQRRLPEVDVEAMQVSTIHSFCAELLRSHREQSGLPGGFRILDGSAQFLVVYANRKELGLSGLLKGHRSDHFDSVLRVFNLATEEMVAPDRLAAWCRDGEARDDADQKESEIWKERAVVAEAYRRYAGMLRDRSLVDFAFLQYYAHELLRAHPDVAAALRDRYRMVLVDEYQDTNAVQERILGLLAEGGRNLTVVGDDDQGIYRFRGATVRNIREFPERYPGTKVVALVHNFRSRNQIVDHSRDVIAHNPGRFAKELEATRGAGSEVLLVYRKTVAEEAAALADLLGRLHRSGRIASYRDAVILLRSVRSYAPAYAEALSSAGIPNEVVGDASLFQRDEVAQLYDLFNFVGTAKEWGDRSLRSPLVGLGPDTNAVLASHKRSLLETADEDGLAALGVTDGKDRRRIRDLLALKRRVLDQRHASALEVLYGLLESTGCVGRFEREGNAAALRNLGLFSQIVASWDEYGHTHNFYPFREYLELMKDGGVEPAPPEAVEAVRIMTIHQAKGLEFPVVVVASVLNGRLPALHRRDPYEVPHALRASGTPEVDDPHLVDERKLFYVAATRARDLLVVGTADVVAKRGGGPSPFVREMFGDDLQAASAFTEDAIRQIESQPASDNEPLPRTSFSQLAYYWQCPVRYKLAVVYGFAVPWLDPVDYGANVHRCLEAVHQRAMRGVFVREEQLPALVEEVWQPSWRRGAQEAGYRGAALAQIKGYLQTHGQGLSRTMHAEAQFATRMARHVLVGKVDLVRRGRDGRLEIVDFKTSGSEPEEMAQARQQLSLYGIGLEKHLTEPIGSVSVHFLADGRVVTWPWNDRERQAAISWLDEVLGRLERQVFPPRTLYCRMCGEFRAICPYAGGEV